MMFSRNVFCGATRPLRPPGILSPLDDPGSWSLRLSGPRPASGYDDLWLSFSPHFTQISPAAYPLVASSPILLSLCTRDTDATPLTEPHRPKVIHHRGSSPNHLFDAAWNRSKPARRVASRRVAQNTCTLASTTITKLSQTRSSNPPRARLHRGLLLFSPCRNLANEDRTAFYASLWYRI